MQMRKVRRQFKNKIENHIQLFCRRARPFSAKRFFNFGSFGIIRGKAPSITLKNAFKFFEKDDEIAEQVGDVVEDAARIEI